MGAGFSNAAFDISDLTIESNIIYDINAPIMAFTDGGKGAYGVLINVGAGAPVGKAEGAIVQSNDIYDLEGLWSHGIGLEGETPNAIVNYNKVYDLLDHKMPSDAEGIRIEDNAGAGSVQINQNSFTTIGGVSYPGLAIHNTASGTVLASCNWYGSSASGTIASRISGNVNYPDWDVLGTDTDIPESVGYQPAIGACDGTPVIIASAVPEHITCGGASGSIAVIFSGGSPTYTINWTGGGPVSGIPGSPHTITGLTAGIYNITVTDTYGSTSVTMAEVLYLPVTNTTGPLHYANISAAINAGATVDGDVIQICAGSYTENVVVNKELTLVGIGTRPIIMAASGDRVVSVTKPNVTLDHLNIKFNQGLVFHGVYAQTTGTFNNLTIEDCKIEGTATTGVTIFGSYGVRLGTQFGVGNDEVTLTDNEILHTGTSPLGRAVRSFNVHGTWDNNILSACTVSREAISQAVC